jgi:DNA-binding NtrC family response regulator
MASYQSNQRQVRSEPSSISILYVAARTDLTAFHAANLRDAGYQVVAASSREEALAAIERSHTDVVVIGHALTLVDRTELVTAARSQQPRPRVVLLYETSIAQTEMADAVLNINSEPQHLLQTIRYLLTGAISDRPN